MKKYHYLLLFVFISLGGGIGYLKHIEQDRSASEKDIVENLEQIVGSFGSLQIMETGQFQLDTILLDGKPLAENDHAGFSLLYPNMANPKIAILWTDCGGSSCGAPNHLLVDLSSNIPFVSELVTELNSNLDLKKIGPGMYRLSGNCSYLKDELGDQRPVSLIYNSDDKKLLFENAAKPDWQFIKFVGEHPDQLLGNSETRQIFLEKLSSEEFKELREYMGTASAITSYHHGRFIYASGMHPHSGGDQASFFVIDQVQNYFLAGIHDNGEVRLLSNLKDQIEMLELERYLNEWLQQYELIWDARKQGIRARTPEDIPLP